MTKNKDPRARIWQIKAELAELGLTDRKLGRIVLQTFRERFPEYNDDINLNNHLVNVWNGRTNDEDIVNKLESISNQLIQQ